MRIIRALLLVLAACSSSSEPKPTPGKDGATPVATPAADAATPAAPAPTPCTYGNEMVMTVEVCEADCDRGELEACGVAGSVLTSPRYVTDLARAQALLQRACDGGIGRACHELAYPLIKGAPAPDPAVAKALLAQAAAALERECTAGDGDACIWIAYSNPDATVQRDAEQRAVAAWRAACDRGLGVACGQLGTSYFMARYGLAGSDARATELWLRGCDLGHAESCSSAAGQLMPRTTATAQVDRGRDLYRKACDLGLGIACNSLAIFSGDDLTLFDRSCELRSNAGCAAAGRVLRDRGDLEGAAQRLRPCCERGDRDCCRLLDRMRPADAGPP